jgi:hypothetical protein
MFFIHFLVPPLFRMTTKLPAILLNTTHHLTPVVLSSQRGQKVSDRGGKPLVAVQVGLVGGSFNKRQIRKECGRKHHNLGGRIDLGEKAS